MNTQTHWYAVYTRTRWEKKIAGMLSNKGITSYCPLTNEMHQWSDRKKMVEEPLFKSYVFVQVMRDQMTQVLQTDGVLHYVQFEDKPAIIREEEIDTIKTWLLRSSHVYVERYDLNANDVVRVTDGPFVARQGNVIGVTNNRVRVYLQSLRYIMTVEIDRTSLQLVTHFDHAGKIA